jgi:hypothetical protein
MLLLHAATGAPQAAGRNSGYCSTYGRSAVVKMKKNHNAAMFNFYVLQKYVNKIYKLFEDLLPPH